MILIIYLNIENNYLKLMSQIKLMTIYNAFLMIFPLIIPVCHFYFIINPKKMIYIQKLQSNIFTNIEIVKQYIQSYYDYITKNDIKPVEPKIVKEIKYEDSYLTKYNLLLEEELSSERLLQLKHSVVFENTPLGNVILYYNIEKESFEYYSDKIIPYRFLEVIGRKYVIMFNCKKIYINMSDEFQRTKEKIIEPPFNHLKSTKDLFVTYKNYKTKQRQTASTQVNIKEKSNRYTSMGKIMNYSFLQKIDKKNLNKKLNISFSEFKQMNLS